MLCTKNQLSAVRVPKTEIQTQLLFSLNFALSGTSPGETFCHGNDLFRSADHGRTSPTACMMDGGHSIQEHCISTVERGRIVCSFPFRDFVNINNISIFQSQEGHFPKRPS